MLDTSTLILYVTEHCNMKCSYCENLHTYPVHFNSEYAKMELVKFSNFPITKIIINGGEPGLLNTTEFEYLYILLLNTFPKLNEIHIQTNGLFIRKFKYEYTKITYKWHCTSVKNFDTILYKVPTFRDTICVVVDDIQDVELLKYISYKKSLYNYSFTLSWVFSYHNRMKIDISDELYEQWINLLLDKNIYFYNFDRYGKDINNFNKNKLNRKLKMDELIHKDHKELKGYLYEK